MFTKPTLVLDEEKCRKNIEAMVGKANRNKVIFRPHFKTHQSLEIGRWFRQLGVEKITVSSFGMAEYFSGEWNDITVAFPVNIREIDTINRLAGRIRLNLLLESVESAEYLVSNLKEMAGFFIKVDVGYHRTGIEVHNSETIDEILAISGKSDSLQFRGFLTHAGHSYKARTRDEVVSIHEETIARLSLLKAKYLKEFPELVFSVGDTPTCSIAEDFTAFDEIRPGNFVFYDLSQHQIGSCSFDEIAVALACPIVAIHKERNEIVIYGGGVHFSKERLRDDKNGEIYGRVVERTNGRWSDPVPGSFVANLSQEHGIVSVPKPEISRYKIGDYLLVLPVHSCMTANLMKSYQTTDSKTIDRL